MRVFTTKYAFTHGIEVVEIDETYGSPSYEDGSYVYGVGAYHPQYRMGRDAFLSEDVAKARAEAMRLTKISALKKQIARLEKKSFV